MEEKKRRGVRQIRVRWAEIEGAEEAGG